MDNNRALCAQHKHGRNSMGTDAFCLNVIHAYGWESAVCLLLLKGERMSSKTNSLKVRRLDLLEQLEQRYAWMSKEKQKWEEADKKYKLAVDQYFADENAWENKIAGALKDALLKVKQIDYSHYEGYSGGHRSGSYSASMSIRLSTEDLIKIIGPLPKKPREVVERPDFLSSRYNSYRSDTPTLYASVYQAIQLLNMSDDEYVTAATYQNALDAL